MLRKLKKILSGPLFSRTGALSFLLAVVSGAIVASVFSFFKITFLAWFSLVPLFYAVFGKDARDRFILGYVFGIVSFAGILYWLVNVSWPGAVCLVMLLALFPAFFCLYNIKGTAGDVIAIPALWVITEMVRSHIFSGFPWALLGYSQFLNVPVIQIADITGPYGVSFLIVMFNFAIFSGTKKMKARMVHNVTCLLLVIASIYYGFNAISSDKGAEGDSLNVSVIQGDIPQEDKWDPAFREAIIDKYEILSRQASNDAPDLVVWPETAVPGYIEGDDYINKRMSSIASGLNSFVIAGALRNSAGKYFNSAYLMSQDGRVNGVYDKVHLVPFGEFIPYEKYITWFRGLIDKPIGEFSHGKKYDLLRFNVKRRSREIGSITSSTRFFEAGVMICFEDIFPYIAGTFVKNGADMLINITNDAWFGETKAPYQHVQSSVFRAVENKVPVIRAANTGISCFIDRFGRISGAVSKNGREIFVEGYSTKAVEVRPSKTIYSVYGDVFGYMCFIFFAVMTVFNALIGKSVDRM